MPASPVRLRAVDAGPACNNACHACPRPAGPNALPLPLPLPSPSPSPSPKEDPDVARAPLLLHGGEPTLHPDFQGFLSRAAAAGIPVIVDSNARAFAVAGRAAQAKQAGLRHVQITLHGAREASHDFLTGTPGSFRQALAGATQLRLAGVRLTVRLIVTRTTLLELGAMAALALGMGAHAVRFSWARMEPRPPGYELPPRPSLVEDPADPKGPLRVDHTTPAGDRAGYDDRREWLVPRYPLAAEALATAARAVTRAGKPALLDGVPQCLVPEGATVATSSPACFAPLPGGDGYGAACDGCTARDRCPGVPLGYLARFGDGELRPRREAVAPSP